MIYDAAVFGCLATRCHTYEIYRGALRWIAPLQYSSGVFLGVYMKYWLRKLGRTNRAQLYIYAYEIFNIVKTRASLNHRAL